MKKLSLIVFLIVLLLSSVTVAQVPVPRVLRPRPNVRNQPPAAPEPNSEVRQPAPQPATSQPANNGPYADDGFTWFEAVSTEALGPNNVPFSTGWVLKSHVRIVGEFPNRSAIKLVVSRAGKPVATGASLFPEPLDPWEPMEMRAGCGEAVNAATGFG
jgi:hypothetical protein